MNRSHRRRGILGNLPQACVISLRAAQDGIDQGRTRRTKIESCQRSAIGRFCQRLIFGGSEEQFLVAIAIVVECFHAWSETSGSLLVGDELGTDETAPKLGAQVRSVQAAEDSVPVSIVALRAKEKVASFLQLFAGFRNATPRRRGIDPASHV